MNKIHQLYLAFFLGFFAQITPQDINSTTQQDIIQKAFSYKLDSVINRYKKEFNVSDHMAMQVEQELKRFLILCSLFPKKQINMYSSDVDDLWHTFVIFTQDYMKFCNTIAGKYIHHNPHTDTSKQNLTKSFEQKQEFINLYTQLFGNKPPEHIWKNLYSNDFIKLWISPCSFASCETCLDPQDDSTSCIDDDDDDDF